MKPLTWAGIELNPTLTGEHLTGEHRGVMLSVWLEEQQYFARAQCEGFNTVALGSTPQTALRRAVQDLSWRTERANDGAKCVLRRWARFDGRLVPMSERVRGK